MSSDDSPLSRANRLADEVAEILGIPLPRIKAGELRTALARIGELRELLPQLASGSSPATGPTTGPPTSATTGPTTPGSFPTARPLSSGPAPRPAPRGDEDDE